MRVTQGTFSFLPDFTDAEIGRAREIDAVGPCLVERGPDDVRILPLDPGAA